MAQVIEKVKQKVAFLPSPLVQGIAGFFSGLIVDHVAMTIWYAYWSGVPTEEQPKRVGLPFRYWWLRSDLPESLLNSITYDDIILQWVIPALILLLSKGKLWIFALSFGFASYLWSQFSDKVLKA